MSALSRLLNLLRRDRISREIDEELQSHLAEAIDRGRDPAEARRALGPQLRLREESRDARLATWLESFVLDFVFGWQQLKKNWVTSLAAVLSLALAIGACGATFQIVDALLLRPLPVEKPGELFSVAYHGRMPDWPETWRDNPHPTFRQLRDAVEEQAELVVSSRSHRRELIFESADTIETAQLQYVSGQLFPMLGLRPALGRLFDRRDDQNPGAHPVAVVSEEYWRTRFGADPDLIGKTFGLSGVLFEVIGVVSGPFSGIEPGVTTDVFVPTMMARDIANPNRSGFRILGRWRNGDRRQETQHATQKRIENLWRTIEHDRWTQLNAVPREWLDRYVSTTQVRLERAGSGFSEPQEAYGRALKSLGGLAVLLLLIACANVSNLMFGLAVARARELALRVAIGAGRLRVVRLLMAEALLLGLFSAALGAALSIWLAPFVVRMLSAAEVPLELTLSIDARAVSFFAATALVTCVLCGLGPALRASAIPVSASLKSGRVALRHKQSGRLLLAGQVGFCFIVVLAGGLFATSLTRLAKLPTGFDANGLVNLDVVAESAQPPSAWQALEERLAGLPGVSNAALAGWPLLDGSSMNARVVTGNGAFSERLVEFFCISPRWLDTMGIPLLEGRGFERGATYPGVALVNHTFVDQFYGGEPVAGRSFQRVGPQDTRTDLRILGTVADSKQNELRAAIPPVAYIPCDAVDAEGVPRARSWGTFVVRGSGSDLALVASAAADEVAAASGFRVRESRTQQAVNGRHTVRERLLATLGVYFSGVALLLTGVGLFGMLHYVFRQRQREVGVRLALGGGAIRVAREIARGAFGMILVGLAGGLVVGIAVMQAISTLLFGVEPTDPTMLAVPVALVTLVSLLAALPVVIRAVRTDPTIVLRAE